MWGREKRGRWIMISNVKQQRDQWEEIEKGGRVESGVKQSQELTCHWSQFKPVTVVWGWVGFVGLWCLDPSLLHYLLSLHNKGVWMWMKAFLHKTMCAGQNVFLGVSIFDLRYFVRPFWPTSQESTDCNNRFHCVVALLWCGQAKEGMMFLHFKCLYYYINMMFLRLLEPTINAEIYFNNIICWF